MKIISARVLVLLALIAGTNALGSTSSFPTFGSLAEGAQKVRLLPGQSEFVFTIQINRVPNGWVVELINNAGIIKRPDQAAVVDPTAVVRVRLKSRMNCQSAREWRSLRTYDKPNLINIELGPGGIEFVELTAAEP